MVLALQGAARVHLGSDNLYVVRHVARIISGREEDRPFELCVDGDLLSLNQNMIAKRGPNSTLVSKVKGHAEMTMVRDGRVRLLDKIGNDMADRGADFGRGRVQPGIIDSRSRYSLPVVLGILLSLTIKGSLLPLLERLLIGMAEVVLLILRFYRLVVLQSVGGFSKPQDPWALGCWFGWLACNCCWS